MTFTPDKTIGYIASRVLVEPWFVLRCPNATSVNLSCRGRMHTTDSHALLTNLNDPQHFQVFPVPHTAFNTPLWLAAAAAAAQPATTFGEIPTRDWLPHHMTPAARYTYEMNVPLPFFVETSPKKARWSDTSSSDEGDAVATVLPVSMLQAPPMDDHILSMLMNRPHQDGMAKQT